MGLGAQTADLSPTNIARCSSGWYWLNPLSCWNMSPSAWGDAASYPMPSVALAGPPAVTVNPDGTVSNAQSQIDASVAQAATQYQANIAAAGEAQMPSGDGLPTGACTFALFGETTCWGPFGNMTALALAAAALAAFYIFGGKR